MDRSDRSDRSARTGQLALAISASILLHMALLATVKLTVAAGPDPTAERDIRLMELPDTDLDLRLEAAAIGEARSGDQSQGPQSAPADEPDPDPGAPLPTLQLALSPSLAAPAAPQGGIQLAVAEAEDLPMLPSRRASRGVQLREGGAAGAPSRGPTLRPASDAARGSGRGSEGDILGGLGGIGAVIGGADCPPGGLGGGIGLPGVRLPRDVSRGRGLTGTTFRQPTTGYRGGSRVTGTGNRFVTIGAGGLPVLDARLQRPRLGRTSGRIASSPIRTTTQGPRRGGVSLKRGPRRP